MHRGSGLENEMNRRLHNILVTGGAVFIGSNFINYIFDLSATTFFFHNIFTDEVFGSLGETES